MAKQLLFVSYNVVHKWNIRNLASNRREHIHTLTSASMQFRTFEGVAGCKVYRYMHQKSLVVKLV